MSKLLKQYEDVILDVRQETGMDALQYATMQYEYGLDYLNVMIHHQMIERVISDSRIFWGWWKLQWENRDIRFLSDGTIHSVNYHGELICNECYRAPYDSYHNVAMLTTGPMYEIALQSMRQLVGFIIDENKKMNQKKQRL